MRRLLTLALALTFATTLFASEDVIRKGFNVTDGGTLRLSADLGAIKVVAGGTGLAIEITRKADGRRGERLMKEHKIDIRQSGNDVIIEDELDRNWSIWSWGDDYEVQWNVRVPARYNVELKTAGGGIELGDLGGTVDARTSGGGIVTGRLGGPATLRTSGGSIRIAGATGSVDARSSGGSIEVGDTTGRVDVRTSGGSIKVARTGGDVVAKTSGGGIRIDEAMGSIDAHTSGGSIHATISRQPAGESRLSTSGGNVTVELGSGIRADLDAKASGGGVKSDVPVTVQGTLDDNELQGQINGGGPKLVLRTSGGGIRIRPRG